MLKILLVIFSFLFSYNYKPIDRNISSYDYDKYEGSSLQLAGLKTYFPPNYDFQRVTLTNKYNVQVSYKINAAGGIHLVKNQGDCGLSGADQSYYQLGPKTSCEFVIKNKNIFKEGKILISKKDDEKSNLELIEIVNTFKLTVEHCKHLVTSANNTFNADTLHTKQLDHNYKPLPSYIKSCKILEQLNFDDHNTIELFDYCISEYHNTLKNQFKVNGQLNLRQYQNHLNELSKFDPDMYCSSATD